jgi:hypothetical protein
LKPSSGDNTGVQDTEHIFLDDEVSVSPLTAPDTTEHHVALDILAETYDGRVGRPIPSLASGFPFR